MIPEEVRAAFKKAHEDHQSDEYAYLVDHRGDNDLILQYCVTPQQNEWMRTRGLTIQTMVEGKYTIDDSPIVHALYKDWNEKLGVKWFQEEDMTQAMLGAIGKNLGAAGITGFRFEGDPKVYPTNQRIDATLAAKEVMDLTKQAKELLGSW